MEGLSRPFFFTSQGARLFGYLHASRGPARPVGVVVVHPFMEERQDAHATLFDLSLTLSNAGFPTLRFDQFGCGDSEGEWEDATLPRWLGDVEAAAATLRAEAHVTEVALVGMRFGATLSALSSRSAGASKLALIQPVARGDTYVSDLLLANLAAEMVLNRRAGLTRELLIESLESGASINLFGYHLTTAQYRAIRAIDLARDADTEGPATLLLDVARTPTARTPKELQTLATALGARARIERAVEPQSLYTEGKVRVMRADEVNRAVLAFLGG